MPVSNSVFRRGGPKEELFLNLADDDTDYSQQTEVKLQNLLGIWKEPRIGGHLSGAIWRPDLQVAEVQLKRGKQLDKMGFTQGKKLYLHIEEAIYLMDRADLLLVVEVDQGQARPITLQEGMELMAGLGTSLAAYQVYWHLRRSGFLVKRYPAQWTLARDKRISGLWDTKLQQQPSPAPGMPAEGAEAAAGLNASAAEALQRLESSSAARPAKRQRIDGTAHEQQQQRQQQGGHGWWPAMAHMPWLESVTPEDISVLPPRTANESAEDAARAALLQRLRPLQRTCSASGPTANPSGSGAFADPGMVAASTTAVAATGEGGGGGGGSAGSRGDEPLPSPPDCHVYDVFSPNPGFSRKRPDPVAFRVALLPQQLPGPPRPAELRALHAALGCRGAVGGRAGGGAKANGKAPLGGGKAAVDSSVAADGGGKGGKGGGRGKGQGGGAGSAVRQGGAQQQQPPPPLRLCSMDKGDLSFFDMAVEGLARIM